VTDSHVLPVKYALVPHNIGLLAAVPAESEFIVNDRIVEAAVLCVI